MTFYRFDYSNFPEVKILFIGNIETKYLKALFYEWLSIYNYKKPFYMIYDTTRILNKPPITFIHSLVKFIKKLKKKNPQYLTKSIMIANDSILSKCILNGAMALASPVSDLYIYWKKENENAINVNNINMISQRAPALFQIIKSNK